MPEVLILPARVHAAGDSESQARAACGSRKVPCIPDRGFEEFVTSDERRNVLVVSFELRQCDPAIGVDDIEALHELIEDSILAPSTHPSILVSKRAILQLDVIDGEDAVPIGVQRLESLSHHCTATVRQAAADCIQKLPDINGPSLVFIEEAKDHVALRVGLQEPELFETVPELLLAKLTAAVEVQELENLLHADSGEQSLALQPPPEAIKQEVQSLGTLDQR
mmetsp:Transcript_49637/g.106332  ORF Transcript_49637/g.106332 Transcript_49637/m.106332 type:complete len:223 (+) Transcript_49637:320-988(+)